MNRRELLSCLIFILGFYIILSNTFPKHPYIGEEV